MTPEEIQQAAQLRAMALRGQEPELEVMSRDADVLSAIGGGMAGWGGKTGAAVSRASLQRGDALRDVAHRRQALPKTPEELEAMQARALKDRAVAANYGKTKPPKDTSFEDATDLRKELSGLPETKALVDTEANYYQLSNAANDATGDVARIYALAKLFDPGGRVTEGDYQAARQGQGPMARFQAYINEVEGQGFLSPQTRANMKAQAELLYKKRKGDYDAVANRFKKIGSKKNLDPEDVVVRPTEPPRASGDASPGDAPPAGMKWQTNKKTGERRLVPIGG